MDLLSQEEFVENLAARYSHIQKNGKRVKLRFTFLTEIPDEEPAACVEHFAEREARLEELPMNTERYFFLV